MQNSNIELKTDIKQRAYLFGLNIIKYLQSIDDQSTIILIIIKQLVRSATSVGANIIEAQAASSRKDFANFLNHSLKSVNESKFWLSLLQDLDHEDQSLLKESEEIGAILGASLITLRKH